VTELKNISKLFHFHFCSMMKLKPSIPYIGLKRSHCKMEMETFSTKGAEIDQALNSEHTVCVEIEGRNS
jgi:hypothetical protein